MRNVLLKPRTIGDIDAQVQKVIRGLGYPEPPLDLRLVRELLKLDKQYYSSGDHSLLREVASKLMVAGIQVFKRPTLISDAVREFSLKALYVPDQKRIFIDRDLPDLKHRWNEAHEVGHDIIPWHQGMMQGDNEQSLTPTCHVQLEAEANYAAGQIIFLGRRFIDEAGDSAASLATVRGLHKRFGNTITSTLWRYVEEVRPDVPMVALVTDHPHVLRRPADFDPRNPCRYFVRSPVFLQRFGHVTELDLFERVVGYCGPQIGGTLGEGEILLQDANGSGHAFHFETFFNRYQALTMGVYRSARG